MLRQASRSTVGGRYSVAGAACLMLLAAAATNCGGDDSPAAGAAGQGGGGAQITCGPGTVLSGTTCVVADAGAAGAAGSSSDGGVVTCGPGTVLEGSLCVAADAGSDAGGAMIKSFSADKLWGDAPLSTTFSWEIVNAPADAECELDGDGDGTFETKLPSCDGQGSAPVTITKVGPADAVLRVKSGAAEATASERVFANKVEWAANVVKVVELPGLVSSVAEPGLVTLTFQNAANAPTLQAGDVLFDPSATGYVRKVVSSTKNGAAVQVTTTDGTLQDVATGGFFGIRDATEGGGNRSAADCDPATWSGGWVGGYLGIPNQEFSKDLSDPDSVSLSFEKGRIGAGFWIKEATFDFNPFHFVVKIDVRTKAAICAEVSASVSASWEPDPIEIPVPGLGQTVDLGFIKANAGLVPQIGTSISGSFTASVDVVLGVETAAYFTLEPNQPMSAGVSLTPSAKFENFDFSAEAEAKLWFAPAVEITWGNPPKECKPDAKAGSDLRIGVKPKVGVKNEISVSLKELCWEAAVYGEASAEAVPPWGIFDCWKVSAPMFADIPIANPPCVQFNPEDAGAGGSGGSSGTGGSGTGGAGTGGSSGTGGTGAGGAAGSGGTGTGGATGTGGSSTGGSAGADAGCTPVVNKVTPTAATLNQSTKFFVGGTCLPSSLAFFIADCANLETLSLGSTLALFECTPTKAGALAGVVKDQPGGTKLKDFTVSVTDPGTVNCPNPLVACNGTCTDVLTSNLHCGACNNQCYANEYCREGMCTAYAVSGQSCNSLAPTCGAYGSQSCCATLPVPGGSFPLGDPATTGPEVSATLSGFNLDMFEVTVGRFRKFVEAYPSFIIMPGQGAHPLIPGSGWNSNWPRAADQAALKSYLNCDPNYQTWTDTVGGNENKPVNCVDWYHAFLFCYWDGGRLPTEAEWEYAAAGGDENRQYPWGSADPNLNWLAVFNCLADGSPAGQCSVNDLPNVGYVPAGAGHWGHMDLGGSMMEWALDWYAGYSTEPCADCANIASGSSRVIRGGSWDASAYYLQSGSRTGYYPTGRSSAWGFRCARGL